MFSIKKILGLSGIGVIASLAIQPNSYSQEINDYEDYRLYCSSIAYQYKLQSSECESHKSRYSEQIVEETKPITVNTTNKKNNNFEVYKLDKDWRKPNPKLPWSKLIIVESDFDKYHAVFDKNYKKYGDGFLIRSNEYGIISKWTTEEISLFAYEKIFCDAILGCREKKATAIGNVLEVSVDSSVYKLYGDNGIFPVSGNLMTALQKADKNTSVRLRINNSIVNDIGKNTVENLAILYSIEEYEDRYTNLVDAKILALKPLSKNSNVQSIVSYTTPGVVKLQTSSGHGSGFIISNTGLILTNRHVVSGNSQATVTFYDGTSEEAQVIKRDRMADLALLKLNKYTDTLHPLPLCHAQYPIVGEDVVAIGNPLSFNFTVTRGIVSGIRQTENQQLIQTDAPINPGNSGGPLLNKYGEVIGIINAKRFAMGIEGLGFAIPINEALNNFGIEIETPIDRQLNHCGNPIEIDSVDILNSQNNSL